MEAVVYPGESLEVDKTVGTPALPPKLDICHLEDETGSYFDDIAVLKAEAGAIFDTVVAARPTRSSRWPASGTTRCRRSVIRATGCIAGRAR